MGKKKQLQAKKPVWKIIPRNVSVCIILYLEWFVSFFYFEVSLQSPVQPGTRGKKTHIFCGRESRFISAMFYVCQLRVFCWLVFKRHESYNGKFIFGYTEPPHHSSHHELKSFLRRQSQQAACHEYYNRLLAQSADFPRHSTKQKFKDPPIFTFKPNFFREFIQISFEEI